MIHWLQHTTGGLLTLAAVSIAVLLLLIIKLKIEPFIALIVVGLLTALAAGLPVGTSSAPPRSRRTPCWKRGSAASSGTSR